MAHGEVVIRFEKVSFEYGHNKPILDAVDFSVRRHMKVTIMGQNGAGKSTLFSLITGERQPEEGAIHLAQRTTIALSRQVIPRDELDLTVREFFEKCFTNKVYDIDPRIDDVLEVVNLKGHEKVHERTIRSFSGGQQARLLLASALIQEPDLLLLDEPTNNLDKNGIAHLTDFLINYYNTCIVISHDANFLNSFTDGVLYLDIHNHKVEQYIGDYFDVVEKISDQIEKENMKNAQLTKKIQENKDKANFFSHKGGKMRLVAKRMRNEAAKAEEEKVNVRKEDKTIRPFIIPVQDDIGGEILKISSFSIMNDYKLIKKKANISLTKKHHLLLTGPNGIGKSTLLESIAKGTAQGIKIADNICLGYYRQDFSTLNFEETVYACLKNAAEKYDEEKLRATAAGFLITSDLIHSKIGHLSEGQKGLVALAQLVLMEPGLLILDEPTNHINFRHLPIIAKALDKYKGPMVLVSHVPEFVKQIRIDYVLELDKSP